MAKRELCTGCAQEVELRGDGRCPRCLARRGATMLDDDAPRQHVLTYRAGAVRGDVAEAFAAEVALLDRVGWRISALAYGGSAGRGFQRSQPLVLTAVYVLGPPSNSALRQAADLAREAKAPVSPAAGLRDYIVADG